MPNNTLKPAAGAIIYNMSERFPRLDAVAVVLATVFTIVINGLAASGAINGISPADVSERYRTVITPAGYAFSIWTLIYVGLVGFSIYQLLPTRYGLFRSIRVPYLLSCVFNCLWILAWHYFYVGICAALIICLLATLLKIIWEQRRPAASLLEAALTKGTFGLYAGWVTAASLVNLLILIRSAELQFSEQAWLVLGGGALIVAALASVLVRIKVGNFIYPLAIAWAAAAIAVGQSSNTAIVVTAAIATVVGLISAGSVVVELKDSTRS